MKSLLIKDTTKEEREKQSIRRYGETAGLTVNSAPDVRIAAEDALRESVRIA